MARYGVGLRSKEGERKVEFAGVNNLILTKIYVNKRVPRIVTSINVGVNSQVDYIIGRRNKKDVALQVIVRRSKSKAVQGC